MPLPSRESTPPAGKGRAASALATALRGHNRGLFDLFVAVNLTAFGVFTLLVSWPRFVAFRTRACAEEFVVYLMVALVLMAAAWLWLRRNPPCPQLLGLFQVAIVLGVVGGGLPYQGKRLYEAALGGVTFDKLVHFVWAFAGGLFVAAVLRRYAAIPAWLERAVVVLAVMGLGAAWELVEYFVAMRVANAGVGLYDNNMQDLLANACGALVSLAPGRRWARLASREEGCGTGG